MLSVVRDYSTVRSPQTVSLKCIYLAERVVDLAVGCFFCVKHQRIGKRLGRYAVSLGFPYGIGPGICVSSYQLFWLPAQPSPWQTISTIILSPVGTEPCLMKYHPCSVNPPEAGFTDLAKHPTHRRGSGSIVSGLE
jgi:hypothetical protein